MSNCINFNSVNYSEVLGVKSSASKKELKSAFSHLIKVYHPDRAPEGEKEKYGEITKKITHAYKVLTDSEYRASCKSDELGIYKYMTRGSLDIDADLQLTSDAFKQDLEAWERNGPSSEDNILFQRPLTHSSQLKPSISLTFAQQSYEKVLQIPVLPLEELLNSIYPNELANLPKISAPLKNFLVSKRVFKPINCEFPQIQLDPYYRSEHKEDYEKAAQINAAKCQEMALFTREDVVDVEEFIRKMNEEYFYKEEVKTFRTFKSFLNEKTRLSERVFLLTPIGLTKYQHSKEISLFGTLPYIKLKPIPKKDLNATQCKTCHKSFSLFTHMKHCTKCGKASCSDCLQFRKFPEYQKPIRVCISHGPKDYREDWKAVVDNNKMNIYMNSKYLLLLDLAGYANRKDFSNWMTKFIELKRYDLAFQCCYSAGGNWLELAKELVRNNCYSEAFSCLDAMKKDWQIKTQLTETERKHPLTKQLPSGEFQVKSNKLTDLDYQDWINASLDNKNNIPLALLFLKKAGLTLDKMFESSMEYFFQPFGKALLHMLFQQGNYQKQVEQTAERLFKKDQLSHQEYAVAAFCFSLLQFTQEQWLAKINSLPIQHAVPMLKYMQMYTKCDLEKVKLNLQHDYIKWISLSSLSFDKLLDHLILDITNGDDQTVPYFLSLTANYNLIEKRDDYLAQKDFVKALFCHRLQENPLSWGELAKKWEKTNLAASTLCLSLEVEDIEVLGDSFFNKGNYQTALRFYLCQKDYKIIKRRLTTIQNNEDRLPYQITLWRFYPGISELLGICDSLFALNKDKEVQNLLLSQLKECSKEYMLIIHQYLSKTPLSFLEQIGLIEKTAPLCQDKISKLWHQALLKENELEFKKRMLKAFTQTDFDALLDLSELISPLTWENVGKILAEFDENRMFGSYKSAVLFMTSLYYLLNPIKPQVWEAMYALTSAMLNFSDEQAMPFYSKIVEKINDLSPASLKFESDHLSRLNFTNLSYFSEKLTGSSVVKLLKLANASLTKLEPFKAAMCYLDLQLTPLGAEGTIGSCLSASLELIKVMQTTQEPNKIYAFKRGIVQLALTICHLTSKGLCPSSQLYIYRSLISLLTEVYEKSSHISSSEIELLTFIYKKFNEVSEYIPLTLAKTLSLFDTIYVNFIYKQLNTTYLNRMRSLPLEINNPKWQSLIFSGVWNGWIEEDFDVERERAMRKLLMHKGSSIKEVESLMKWPGLVRDPDGWLPPEAKPLNLSGKKFSQVQGMTVNLETGEISFSLTTSDEPMENLFDLEDVRDVLKLGISSAYVSFEETDLNFPNQPIQTVKYAPSNIAKTGFWGTLVHSDFLLKILSMGTEVSAEPPFALRDIKEGLFYAMPLDLRQKYDAVFDDDFALLAERVHRFWIEAVSIDYARHEDGNKITYEIGSCTMKVQKHLMKRDKNGKLIDTESDEDTTSTEAKFAKFMSEEYDRLGRYFPILARLKELAKLQALSRFVKEINASMIHNAENVSISSEKVKEELAYYRKQVTYPINVEQRISEYRLKYPVHYSQEYELREFISKECAKEEQSYVTHLAQILKQEFHININIEFSVKNWLQQGPTAEFVNLLKTYKEEKIKQDLLVICDTFKQAGFSTELNESENNEREIFIPAAFKKDKYRRVYGGVTMQANLNRVSNINNGSGGSLPPGGNSNGALVSRPRYIVSLDKFGQINGTMTGVDRVTGNTYQIVDHGSCVRDQFNANNLKPNTLAYWKTHVGYTMTEHYTSHLNQHRHDHKINGITDCYDKNGNLVDSYKSGSKNHRC